MFGSQRNYPSQGTVSGPGSRPGTDGCGRFWSHTDGPRLAESVSFGLVSTAQSRFTLGRASEDPGQAQSNVQGRIGLGKRHISKNSHQPIDKTVFSPTMTNAIRLRVKVE